MAILTTIGNILLFILVLSIVICIHELGHFYFARKAGILCHEFSFGMGPRLISKKFGETTFSLRAFPFGGYVSMAGEEIQSEVVKAGDKIRIGLDESNHINKIVVNANNAKYKDLLEITVTDIDLKGAGTDKLHINEYVVDPKAFYVMDKMSIQIAPLNRNFNYKNKRQRFMATFGGPMMNIVLAFVVFLFSALVYGVTLYDSAVVGEVNEALPAYGLVEKGDKIISINGVEVVAWASDNAALHTVTSELAKYQANDTFVLVVERDGVEHTLSPITPSYLFYGLGFTSTAGSEALIIGEPLYAETELLAGDEIVSIDGTLFTTWSEVIDYALAHPEGSTEEDPTVIVVKRNGVILDPISYVAYGQDTLDAMGYQTFYTRIGISCSTGFSFFGSFETALVSLKNASLSIYQTLWLLLTSKQVNIGDLSGFVGIYSMTAQAAAQGFQTLLSWVGLLSVNLGIVNLLPIPALDGGRLAFIAYEAVTKKKPNAKVENWLNTIVLFLLLGLMIFITYKDILRLFM